VLFTRIKLVKQLSQNQLCASITTVYHIVPLQSAVTMKLYFLNLWTSLLAWLGYKARHAKQSGMPFWMGFLLYCLAYPLLAFTVVWAICQVIQGETLWWHSLLRANPTTLQVFATVSPCFFVVIEGFNSYTNR
jgi:uncharacterized membrane protein YhdT